MIRQREEWDNFRPEEPENERLNYRISQEVGEAIEPPANSLVESFKTTPEKFIWPKIPEQEKSIDVSGESISEEKPAPLESLREEREQRDNLEIERVRRELKEDIPDFIPPSEAGDDGDGGGNKNEGISIHNSVEIKLTQYKTCERCMGSGRKWFILKCPRCKGLGSTPVSQVTPVI
ncbi:MAG: hypothetical protein Q7S15_02105 [bacterium]|nr:hypothetical protein [bacterium]